MSDTTQPRVLVVDDDPSVTQIVERFVRDHGFDVISRSDGQPVLDALPQMTPDVALVGQDLFRPLRDAHPACHVIVTAPQPSMDSAIDAVKLGALDYLPKPIDWDRLGALLETVRYAFARRQRLLTADSELASQFEFNGMVGRSPVMQELFDSIRRLAPHVNTALVTGEPGTGKELVARALHALGRRREHGFVRSNGAGVDEALVGTKDGGTLFLDEVGALALVDQSRLLQALEHERVCVIAASSRRIRDDVRAGRFREDLFNRLNAVSVAVPPLRDRREDIPYLTATFVKQFAGRFEKPIAGVTPGAERLLLNGMWPGNVRELRSVLERSCRASESRLLTERDVLTACNDHRAANGLSASPPRGNGHTGATQVDVTRDQVANALQQVSGNRSAAARVLGISRRALYRRLDSFGLR
jgi:two-component system, NtrC family, response regulator HydG